MAETYAIVESGGKQYRAEKGTTLRRRPPARRRGRQGQPARGDVPRRRGRRRSTADNLEKVKVEATVAGHERGEKIRVFKYRAKKGYRKRAGHRSELTRLEVTEVKMLTRKPAAPKAEPKPKAEPAKQKAGGGRRSRAGEEAGREEAGREEAGGQEAGSAKKPAAKKPAAKKTEEGELADGAQEGTRLEPQRPRLEPEDARGQGVRRPAGRRRRDHRPPARHPLPPRRRRRPRPRPHDLRHPRRAWSSSRPPARAASSRSSRPSSRRPPLGSRSPPPD